jgi:hypothetical protein
MRKCLGFGVVGALALVAGCEEARTCTAKSVASISGQVRDHQGNAVPVVSARARQGNRSWECYAGLGSYACRDLVAGPTDVEVVAAGQTLSGKVELTWEEGNEDCHTQAETLDFALQGQGCPPASGDAVRVLVRNMEESGAESVQVHFDLELAQTHSELGVCEPDGDTFVCPAAAPYPLTYPLLVSVGEGVLVQRRVFVPAEDCAVSTQEVTIDLARLTCPDESVPALQGSVVELSSGERVHPERVYVLQSSGQLLECEVNGEGEFTCPAQQERRGTYPVAVEVRGSLYYQSALFSDEGCVTGTQTVTVGI